MLKVDLQSVRMDSAALGGGIFAGSIRPNGTTESGEDTGVDATAVSSRCGCLEEPAAGSKRRERYCRPHLVPKLERHKRRDCICRQGLVRNSWGDCITNKECMSCKCHPNKDFNLCARACPVLCNEPIRTSCSKECVLGCDCPPGFVRDPKQKRNRCVKAANCALRCPSHSKFQFCVSTCAPKCGQRTSGNCATRCQRGGCVCDPGYAEVEHNGETICVPQGECSRYIVAMPPLPVGRPGLVGGGFSSVGAAGGSTTTGMGVTSTGKLGLQRLREEVSTVLQRTNTRFLFKEVRLRMRLPTWLCTRSQNEEKPVCQDKKVRTHVPSTFEFSKLCVYLRTKVRQAAAQILCYALPKRRLRLL
ncbi:hypothetical protein MTO96_042117 [Rhipicephalus appendiculatus]